MKNIRWGKKNRWRNEKRYIKIYEAPSNLWEWRESIKTLIIVKRVRKVKNKRQKEKAYFISDLPIKMWAKKFWEIIRNHWSIENSLHYVKDVTQWEDKSKIHTWNQPYTISIMRSMSLNIFRKLWYTNMAQAQRLLSHNIQLFHSLILA